VVLQQHAKVITSGSVIEGGRGFAAAASVAAAVFPPGPPRI
jgi:hypothetical protein